MSAFAALSSAVVIFLVGALTLEDHVARDAILDNKAEFGLVDYILLGSEIDHQLLRQELAFIIIHWHWGHAQTSGHNSQWKRFTLKHTLQTNVKTIEFYLHQSD